MSNVRRVYVEKKPEFAVSAKELRHEIKHYLGIQTVTDVRVLIRYDVENLSDTTFEKACSGIFAEPPVDTLYKESFPLKEESHVFSVEYLPGQFDQRADSAEQCVQFIKEDEKPIIRTATTYVIEGTVTEEEFGAIKNHCINPVDSRETGMEKPETLVTVFEEPEDVKVFDGFQNMPQEELKKLYDSLGLAMTFKDFLHIQKYYSREEHRDPTMTEIRVLDTYWSDHCRHTTFSTELKEIIFGEGDYKEPIVNTYKQYLKDHSEIFAGREDKFVCLMDLALMAMRKLKKEGKLQDQEESEEINACSIVVPIKVDGVEEEWLINFKNETHNHPTEIEPFGGAATCLGGAIRDPLSGRTYVYQAMRVTGAADPTVSVKDTLKGKLPQKKLVRGAAAGYSSYGNQIGLATGAVKEIYHPDYVAKRMEIGAVLGAAPRRAVIRETSDPGDIIILLGGRTGRDGCGGATGSSKVHTEESIETCGAEVQKGNPPTERKIQRLFRREEVSALIKKCNDFGAGGVSVAIGELADGLRVDLDKVPKKYAGLDGTEIAISESQERMAVVVDPKDVKQFLDYAKEENLEAVEVAVVTESPRLVLSWRGKEIVNISRAFLDTNGAHQETSVEVEIPNKKDTIFVKEAVQDVKGKWLAMLSDLNVCSQKGLVEMFDGSIGAGSVFMPHGGKYQMTETQAMVAKVPVQNGSTDSVSMMSYGFDPYLSSWSPYHGAVYAVVESVAKIVASGGDYRKIRFTFQEYFRRMTEDPKRWSQPFAALLGAYDAQLGFGLPSIGGKDSMSGTFQDIDVPPTLVSFAVDMATEKDIITPELKKAGNKLVWMRIEKDGYDLPVYGQLMDQYGKFESDIHNGRIVSAYALDRHGVMAAVSKMAFGNGLGLKIEHSMDAGELFAPAFGDLVAEVPADQVGELAISYTVIGEVTDDGIFSYGNTEITLCEAKTAWTETLEKVFATRSSADSKEVLEDNLYDTKDIHICSHKIGQPTVFIPVFPGTNCEYDSKRAFERAGAKVITKVFKNLDAEDIRHSVAEFENAISQAQMIMFPGGFSAGDEPDGSAKFFATAFQNAKIKEAVEKLLNERDGLALGVCNGFQALIKLGLVPYGTITGQKEDSPTLTYNTIGRHISKMVYTKVVTNKSPWLQEASLGGVYTNPASHGEGRFVASEEWLDKLFANGQVATQYCDIDGVISMDEEWNVNGSYRAIEGITSPDGRVLGKMAHSERRDNSVAINIYGEQDMKIFESGVKYFK
ncbi:phosphoribosylformylglycinamidine synthase [Eubacterium sp. am_0171]|uniref:phosphoribosylformylglycinamidine synthase n=1 Tax=unclassified Eubacterium (in: firmicutes) TaxID=2624479 RepID=UPI00102094D7|nr:MULTISPECIES: phosphoribosylformylglycinamidine synthase [unclassified Eubacterium (in: firmicutes)]MSC85076.1 phosphoribosylformylglycinamidine synthase [Eubacterium sp. BIOML-A1]MSD05571.1 phosphoribosylformylglycinamidine synthase [Eubacterium sp. BIOML-A2]RYT24645.1 phosphoribosylformylglycinamidine synthase [Eubacterium sp. am_0171]